MMGAVFSCPQAQAQAQAQAADVVSKGDKISFDVISVKPNHSGEKPGNIHPLPNGIRMENIPLNLMVRQAYGLAYNRLIVGGPQWMGTESFDVDARLTGSDLERLDKIPSDQRTRVMLQLILADRFKLAVHRETQQLADTILFLQRRG